MPSGSFTPRQNGWRASGRGPPRPARSPRPPAASSRNWAVVRPSSKSTIARSCAGVGAAPWAWPVVASRAWFTKLSRHRLAGAVSRPSHITVLRNERFVVGSGRRYMEADVSGASQRVGIVDVDDLELRAGRHSEPDADQALRQQQAVGLRGAFERGDVGSLAVRAVIGAEDRVEAPGLVEPGLELDRRDGPRSAGRWQVKQVRPLVPRSWKNGLSSSTVPAADTVECAPLGLVNVSCIGRSSSAAIRLDATIAIASTSVAASMAPVIELRIVEPPCCSDRKRRGKHDSASMAANRAFVVAFHPRLSAPVEGPRGYRPLDTRRLRRTWRCRRRRCVVHRAVRRAAPHGAARAGQARRRRDPRRHDAAARGLPRHLQAARARRFPTATASWATPRG